MTEWIELGTPEELSAARDQESTLIEMKLSLASFVRSSREQNKLSQTEIAQRLHSSQSRVAKLEAGDPKVSLDLLVRAALATGSKRFDIARVFAARRHVRGR